MQKKAFDKIQLLSIIKTLGGKIEQFFLSCGKGHLSKTILNSEICTFPLRSGTRHGYLFKLIPFSIILEVLAS